MCYVTSLGCRPQLVAPGRPGDHLRLSVRGGQLALVRARHVHDAGARGARTAADFARPNGVQHSALHGHLRARAHLLLSYIVLH